MASNLGEHVPERTTNTLFSHNVDVCFMLAFDVLRVEGIIADAARGTICESQNTSFDEAVDIERDGPDCDCFVTASKLSFEVLTRRVIVLTCLYLA